MRLPDDLIPPDVPVRDNFGRVYYNKVCALANGVLVRDMEIVTFKERHTYLDSGTHVPKYIGLCAQCGAII